MKVLAKLYYLGSMEGFSHQSAVTGTSYSFPTPAIPAKIVDERDIAFYQAHESFKVELAAEPVKEGVKETFSEPVAQKAALKPDAPEADKEKKAPIKKKE